MIGRCGDGKLPLADAQSALYSRGIASASRGAPGTATASAMHVLALEYQHSGHHLEHLSYLLPALIRSADAVTVAVTREAAFSREFAEYIEPFRADVAIDLSMTQVVERSVGVPRSIEIFRRFCAAVGNVRPDRVIVPSADAMTFGSLAGVPKGLRTVVAATPIDVCLHAGPEGMADRSLGQRARAWLLPFAAEQAPWTRIRFLNPHVFESMRQRRTRRLADPGAVPSPLPTSRQIDRRASRAELGLPTSGRYICAAGHLGLTWKGTDLLLAAFRHLRRRPDDRLLLAGACGLLLKALIASTYQDLIDAGSLLLIDRFLSSRELDAVCTAADVMCVPYPRFERVSGVLLRSVAARRPVVTTNTGWPGDIVRRFRVGWTCDVTSPEALLATLQQALDRSGEDLDGPLLDMLLRYHAIENFTAHWLSDYARFRANSGPQPYAWDQLKEDAARVRSK